MKRNPKEEYENDRAKNKFGIEIHISQATSGKNGYYCLGCSAEMIAKKGPIMPDHFAHHAHDVERRKNCIYYSETERHKLAKEILQRLKQVKVPSIKIFNKTPGSYNYNIIKQSEFIFASEVKNEMEFYRDEFYNVQFGRGITFKDKSEYKLLFKPDVAFFDENNNPILLIELVSTHAANEEKITKIKNLGIDTLQIKIPKGSPDEIENIFFKTQNTKWLYNYESENTEFKPSSFNQSISQIDEFERELFERSNNIKCRISEVNNFIRKINKIMGTTEFSKARREIETEIHRVENSRERESKEFESRRTEIHQRVYDSFNESRRRINLEEDEFEREKRKFEEEEARFEAELRNLEKRYLSKVGELENRRIQLEHSKRQFEPKCIIEVREIERFLQEHGAEPSTLEEMEERIRIDRRSIENFFFNKNEEIRIDSEKESAEIERTEIEIRNTEEEDNRIESKKRIEFEFRERKIREEYEEFRNATIDAIAREDPSRVPRIAQKLNWAIFRREELTVQTSNRIKYQKFLQLREHINDGSYKSWN